MRFHVFPEGRLCSIRRALMLWLVPMFLVVAVASAGVSYWIYNRMVAGFMDDQMVQLGQSVALHEELVAPPGQNAERVHKWGVYVTQVFDGRGQPLVSSWDGVPAQRIANPGFHDLRAAGHDWRVYVTDPTPEGRTVQVLQSGSFRSHLAFERAGAAVLPVLVLLPLSMVVLWGIARAMSLALRDIGTQAARLDAHNLAPLPLEHVPDEIRPLVGSFNGLLARVKDAFHVQRRFVQDAAHELRTPIAALSLQMENLRADLAGGATAQRFEQLEAGVRRAQRLVDQLLKMSRQEAAAAEGGASVDLQEQLRESIHTLIALADQRHIDLGLVAPEGAAPVALRCAPGDLRSALDNLIENALRYTPEGGVVDVRLVPTAGGAAVEVVDTGPGIPADMLPRVFDRFFRVPGSAPGGSGLGLAIAQAAAQRCGLKLTLRNRDDRSGLVARLEVAAQGAA